MTDHFLLVQHSQLMGLEPQGQKVAIVTGATDGVGYEVAKALVCEGYHLFAVGRNPEKGARCVADDFDVRDCSPPPSSFS